MCAGVSWVFKSLFGGIQSIMRDNSSIRKVQEIILLFLSIIFSSDLQWQSVCERAFTVEEQCQPEVETGWL